MNLTTVGINGVPVETYGMTPIQFEEWLSAPAVQLASVQVVGRMGQNPSVAGISYSRPPLLLGGQTPGASLTADRQSVSAWYLATQGRVEIEAVDQPGRVLYGWLASAKATSQAVSATLLDPRIQIAAAFNFPDPFWYDRSPVTLGGAANARLVLPIGTAPTRLRLGLCGPYTNPTITFRDRTGTPIAQLRFTDTAADNTVVLDLNFGAQLEALKSAFIDRYVSGVRSARNNGIGLLNGGDSLGQCPIDPLDAPTVETSSGSLTGVAWRAYLA